jgi:2-oxo-3-hexenedioate decarboxylase
VLKKALKGPGCHIGSVLAATDFVLPGIEVIDSRYRDFKFDLKSVIADNTSAARFVIGGNPVSVGDVDLRTVGIVLEKNGEPVAFGAGAAVLGHPAAAIAMMANHLGARGEEIPAGTLILSGGVTEAVAVAPGDNVTLKIQGMGSTSLRFI